MSDLPPFFRWGDCQSDDPKKPDSLDVTFRELETFETEYGINVNASINGTDYAVPLLNFNSANKSLYKKFKSGVKSGLIKVGKKVVIKTWMGTSKNDRKIRRWELEESS